MSVWEEASVYLAYLHRERRSSELVGKGINGKKFWFQRMRKASRVTYQNSRHLSERNMK